MPTIAKMVGRVRGIDPGGYIENHEAEQFHLGNDGSGYIVQGLPARAELVRLGQSWQVMSAAFTALTAIPTTASIFALWNGEPQGGMSYAIDSLALVKIVNDVTTADTFGLHAQLMRQPVAAPTDAGNAFRSLSGKYNYGGRARTVVNITPLTGRWDHVATSPQTTPAVAGSAWETIDIPVFGRYLVPPGGALALHVSEVTATASTFRAVIRFHEVQLPVVG